VEESSKGRGSVVTGREREDVERVAEVALL
jgi:hypothetical protein